MKNRSKKNSDFPAEGPWLDDDLVVWRVRKNQSCSMCRRPLKKQRQDLASMEQRANRWFPTCLQCLHIDQLAFLPAGDSRVTRMASRLSSRRAVVMTTRHKTLRREGILVEISALREACEKYDIELPPKLLKTRDQTSLTNPRRLQKLQKSPNLQTMPIHKCCPSVSAPDIRAAPIRWSKKSRTLQCRPIYRNTLKTLNLPPQKTSILALY